jgi:hypothetical protein
MGCALVFALCLQTARAVAQEPAAVEHALADGDFPEVRRLASTALAQGARTRAELLTFYRALAVAQARLGESEEAQRSFVCLLALDPAFKLDADAPVEVRSPFMEARGFWSLHADRLSGAAELSADASTLWVSLRDPAGLVSRILVHVRFQGQARYLERVLTPSEDLTISLQALGPSASVVEYTLALLDPNANRIWELGTDAQPERLSTPAVAPLPTPVGDVTPAVHEPAEQGPVRSRTPYIWSGALALALGAGATAAAAYAHYERQQYAARWNDGDCHGSGFTRGSLCKREHQHVTDFERWAIGAYAAGGVALIAGTVLLLVAPRERGDKRNDAPKATALGCGEGPGWIGITCRKRF